MCGVLSASQQQVMDSCSHFMQGGAPPWTVRTAPELPNMFSYPPGLSGSIDSRDGTKGAGKGGSSGNVSATSGGDGRGALAGVCAAPAEGSTGEAWGQQLAPHGPGIGKGTAPCPARNQDFGNAQACTQYIGYQQATRNDKCARVHTAPELPHWDVQWENDNWQGKGVAIPVGRVRGDMFDQRGCMKGGGWPGSGPSDGNGKGGNGMGIQQYQEQPHRRQQHQQAPGGYPPQQSQPPTSFPSQPQQPPGSFTPKQQQPLGGYPPQQQQHVHRPQHPPGQYARPAGPQQKFDPEMLRSANASRPSMDLHSLTEELEARLMSIHGSAEPRRRWHRPEEGSSWTCPELQQFNMRGSAMPGDAPARGPPGLQQMPRHQRLQV